MCVNTLAMASAGMKADKKLFPPFEIKTINYKLVAL